MIQFPFPISEINFGIRYSALVHAADRQNAQREKQLLNPAIGVQNHETVIELTHRFSLRKGALFIQHDFQYILRPGGTGPIDNALVLGCQFGIHF
ncbi:carbohydrate porin [Pedosphaera parvula]|uniref:carbohydrate porin n=1 Tax=Pedosphaera parvula TaxID=1032527 RepID=UPI000A014BA0